MKRVASLVPLVVAAFLLQFQSASASLADYIFAVGSGTSMTATWTNIFAGSQRSRATHAGQTSQVTLPFTFNFDGNPYTQITVSSHGVIAFGSTAPSSASNALTGNSQPIITPFWDAIYVGGGAPNSACAYSPAIRRGVVGTTPNRVFIIDYWKVAREYSNNSRYGPLFIDFQVRLYETSSRIEFHYANTTATWPACIANYWGTGSTATSASIGIAATSSDFMSITPSGSSASMSRTTANDNINLQSTLINPNVTYTFTPCLVLANGNVAQGGTAAMNTGDVLMSNISLQRGESGTYTPFTITMPMAGCAARFLNFSLTGANAADYSISPIGARTINAGETIPVNVTFTPQSLGQRTATLTITDTRGATRQYTLRATGTPRLSWTPNLASGGTPTLANGDTLIKDIIVRRNVPTDFTPFTLLNFSTNGAIPPAQVTYSIDSAGFVSTQYRLITPNTVFLGPGQSHTPIIRFTGTGLGPQNGHLTVNADGEIRRFALKAISGAPGITIVPVGGPPEPLTPTVPLFHQRFACTGEEITSFPLTVTNPGQFLLTVTAIDIYQVDTTITQGTPMFPLVRDAQGRVVRSNDYVLSPSPGVIPIGANSTIPVPFTLQPGESRTIYATFIGQRPGKRFGRVFMRTDAENAFGTDTTLGADPFMSVGLLNFDLVARSLGSSLASNAAGLKLKPVVFPHTRLGDTTFVSFPVANAGACDLRINRNKLRISSGDVNEFRLMTSLGRASLDATTGDYVLAPGLVDTITIRFIPSRSGTRNARLWIQTNDSTIVNPGIAERGAHYLDLHGRGLAGLDVRDLVLDPVVIGSSVAGVAQIENSQTSIVSVASISFAGDDAAEFSEDASNPWTARPFNVLPGQKLELGVRMTPVGSAGPRRTTMILVTTTGDTIRLSIRGEAGTQDLIVSPSSLFENVTIASGQTKRQSVMIANNGTLPVRITSITITGPDSAMYFAGVMPRRNLEGGATEYLEITYAPTQPGQTSAELVITASNGQTYTVALGGTALRIRRDPIDPPSTGAPTYGATPDRNSAGKNRPSLR